MALDETVEQSQQTKEKRLIWHEVQGNSFVSEQQQQVNDQDKLIQLYKEALAYK